MLNGKCETVELVKLCYYEYHNSYFKLSAYSKHPNALLLG